MLGREHREAEKLTAPGRIGAVRAEMRMPEPGAGGLLPTVPPEVREIPEPVDHRVEERDGDSVSLAGRAPPHERSEGCYRRVARGPHVAGRDTYPRRCLWRARNRDQPGLPLHDQVVGVLPRIGAVRPVAGYLRVDHVGPERADTRLVQRDSRRPARREVLQEHVRGRDERLDAGRAAGSFRSSSTLLLPRLTQTKPVERPFAAVSHPRVTSPVPGRSTLTTSAPRSARRRVASGPASPFSQATTRMPVSGSTRAS